MKTSNIEKPIFDLDFIKDEEIKDKIISICTLAVLIGGYIRLSPVQYIQNYEFNQITGDCKRGSDCRYIHLSIYNSKYDHINIEFKLIDLSLKINVVIYKNSEMCQYDDFLSYIDILNYAQNIIF